MMRSILRPALVAAALVAAGGFAATGVSSAPDPTVAHGHALFLSIGCYECHGTVGQGGAAGARIAPGPIPYAALSAYVRRPRGQMPPYTEKVLSDTDLRAIYAYLASIPKAPGTTAER